MRLEVAGHSVRIFFLWIALVMMAGGFLFSGIALYITVIRAERNSEVICALKYDYQRRNAAAENYLQQILAGDVPLIPGLSIASLRADIEARKTTIHALSGVDCTAGSLSKLGKEVNT